jgi:tetraacyldisaccharide 4'-kinase
MKARRGWAWPLVPLYATGLAAKDVLRRAGVLGTQKLKWPVVSVGSLSAGGAGKTPVVIALSELLRGSGWDVDVLSRGYGRSGSGVERVDPEAADAAGRFGDEPVVIAQRAGVPVWVGAERFAAGSAAEVVEEVTRGVHLLDDGFQHRQLVRTVDMVVVTEEDLEEALLPAGNRRESLAALRRAEVVVLREEERGRIEARVRGLMREGAAMWVVRRAVEFPGASDGLDSKGGVVAFCGIARPDNFIDTLRTGGARVVDSIAFPDHHRYTAENMRQLTESLRARAGDAFITTEKDAVKLTPDLRAQLEAAAPVFVARLQAAFLDPQAVARDLEARLR